MPCDLSKFILSPLVFSQFNTTKLSLLLVCCLSGLLSGCNEQESSRQTLQSIDNTEQHKNSQQKKAIAKSENDIRDAYINYLNHASK